MLLVIDAGNTNITLGAYKEDQLLFTARLATDTTLTGDQVAIAIHNLFELNQIPETGFRGGMISSVVPELTHALQNGVKKVIGKVPFTIGPEVKTGLDIKIDNPAELGADLIAGAVAAKAAYPLPALVVDLGTATKISVLDETGAFLGCSIAPGLRLSLNALANGASQLSQISLVEPKHAVGTNTVDSIRSGMVYGTADMLDGLCNRMEAELGTKIKTIVATGGLSGICSHCKHDMVRDPDLLLKGLKLIFEQN